MTKILKTYRLSEETVQAIEGRDKKKYPTASDFIEAKILMPTDETKEILSRVSIELEEVKTLLKEEHKEGEQKEIGAWKPGDPTFII